MSWMFVMGLLPFVGEPVSDFVGDRFFEGEEFVLLTPLFNCWLNMLMNALVVFGGSGTRSMDGPKTLSSFLNLLTAKMAQMWYLADSSFGRSGIIERDLLYKLEVSVFKLAGSV
ncbi:hypothetical protein WICPIJ_006874 [Wickerhamomyces pijperi]|uniref:Uncharacterized protein n=1 Tax=Wickerhamomyces pijperi TaxID=599730 RepID=A0A9P8Q1K4_WICPI|nr:hypothetical protein WICPIJ_006874 [Wickerhamomyces pijperi]